METVLLGLAVVVTHGTGAPLGASKLAAMVGTSPQTATRKLEYLQNAGVVRRNGRQYEINMDRLGSIPGIEERLLRVARQVIKCAEVIKEQLEQEGKL